MRGDGLWLISGRFKHQLKSSDKGRSFAPLYDFVIDLNPRHLFSLETMYISGWLSISSRV